MILRRDCGRYCAATAVQECVEAATIVSQKPPRATKRLLMPTPPIQDAIIRGPRLRIADKAKAIQDAIIRSDAAADLSDKSRASTDK